MLFTTKSGDKIKWLGEGSCSLGLVHFAAATPFALKQKAVFSLPCLGEHHWLRTNSLIRLAALRFLTRDTSLSFAPLVRSLSMSKSACVCSAGGARELAKGASTAGVVSLDALCFAEGNGLSRYIDLRVWRWRRCPKRKYPPSGASPRSGCPSRGVWATPAQSSDVHPHYWRGAHSTSPTTLRGCNVTVLRFAPSP